MDVNEELELLCENAKKKNSRGGGGGPEGVGGVRVDVNQELKLL